VVPILIYAELANALLKATRRGRITSEKSDEVLDLVGDLPLETIDWGHWSSSLVFLGERFGLTAYDAWYLYLAIALKLPLATRDAALAAAAREAGVPLVTP